MTDSRVQEEGSKKETEEKEKMGNLRQKGSRVREGCCLLEGFRIGWDIEVEGYIGHEKNGQTSEV